MNPINSQFLDVCMNPKNQPDPPVSCHRDCRGLPWEFFRPVTGIGSKSSSSVPASALACWGSKSEMRRDESAEDKRKVCWWCESVKEWKDRKKELCGQLKGWLQNWLKTFFLITSLTVINIFIKLAITAKKKKKKSSHPLLSKGTKPAW